MNIKTLTAVGFALLVGFASAADTWYVAKSGNDTTGNGSKENPYKTIQKGIDRASAGDTVSVGEGDFSDIGQTMTLEGLSVPTVAVITKKITLQGAGRGKTFITGAYGDGTGGFSQTGPGAHRCLYCMADGSGSSVRDMTIRNGATVRANTGVNNDADLGGGVVCKEGKVLYLYDCDLLDCRAGEGAATSRDVRACRCYFAGNKARGTSQVCYRNSYHFDCLFENNGPTSASGCIFTYVQDYSVVNCTFLNNSVSRIFQANTNKKAKGYNCLIFGTMALENGADTTCYDLQNVVQNLNANDPFKAFSEQGCRWSVGKNLQYLSPAEDDWRSVEGNAIVGEGDASLVTEEATGFPAEEIATDFNNNPRIVNGKVSVGCFEPTEVVKLCGSFLFAGDAILTKNGKTRGDVQGVSGRWWGVEGVGQVRVGYKGADELFGYEVANVGGIEGGASYTAVRFPDNNGDRGFWLTPTRGGIATITAIPATEIKWVDDDADASGADGSELKPFKTLKDAVEAISARGLLKVKPGVYDEGSSTADSGKYRVLLSKDVAIRSVGGAEQTILKGGSDIAAIVYSSDNSRSAQIQGFTLTGCANDPSRDVGQGETGAAILCNVQNESARGVSEGVHLTDSVVSNNVSPRVCTGGWLERCLLVDNFTTVENMNKGTDGKRGTQAYGSILSGCISYYSAPYFTAGNRPTANTCAHQNTTALNCSIYVPKLDASGKTYRTVNVPNGSTVCINSAMADPQCDDYLPEKGPFAAGNLASPGQSAQWITATPSGTFFLDAPNRKFRPLEGSAGLSFGVVTTNLYVRYETGDFEGKSLAYEVNGKPIPGALQTVERMVVVSSDSGRGTVSPSGSFFASEGWPKTFTATADNHRFIGWIVDGDTNLTSETTYSYSPDLSHERLSLSPLFSPDLYVDANAADDSGTGLSPETAKKKLSSIGAIAVPGDVIHAARGDYNDGTMTQAAVIFQTANYSPSRVVLVENVTLVAEEGCDVTYITGNPTKGANGVRCVAAMGGAVVRGFTLRNGATFDTTGGERDDNVGGCVLAPKADGAATARFEDCVISSGYARTGGCVCGGYLLRCTVYGGSGSAGASLTQYSMHDHCIVRGAYNTGIRDHYGIRSSLVINRGSGTSVYDMAAANDDVSCENSILVLLNKDTSLKATAPMHKNIRNCIWNVGGNVAKIDDATSCNVVTCAVDTTSLETARISLGLDDDFRPLPGSPAIDVGDMALLAAVADPEHDIDGNQRVFNAHVDLGPYEHDVRDEFTAAICGRRANVTTASPMSELNGSVVEVPDGESIGITWAKRDAGQAAKLEIAALESGATLLVYDGDELLTTVQNAGIYVITPESLVANLRLEAQGGLASIASFVPEKQGLCIIVQ